MSSHVTAETGRSAAVGWRFKLCIALFALALLIWLLVPLAATLGMTAARVAGLTGTVFVANKLLLLALVGMLGKTRVPAAEAHDVPVPVWLRAGGDVGPARHRTGLVMFCLPLVSAWLEPYVDALAPGLRPNLWQLQLLGDLMFAASFFVLGGNFCAKIRALFVRTAVTLDPGEQEFGDALHS